MDQLRHGRLNRIFDVSNTKYLPGPETVARLLKKRKVETASEEEVVPIKYKGVKTEEAKESFVAYWG
jgi:hypothetical protein